MPPCVMLRLLPGLLEELAQRGSACCECRYLSTRAKSGRGAPRRGRPEAAGPFIDQPSLAQRQPQVGSRPSGVPRRRLDALAGRLLSQRDPDLFVVLGQFQGLTRDVRRVASDEAARELLVRDQTPTSGFLRRLHELHSTSLTCVEPRWRKVQTAALLHGAAGDLCDRLELHQ